MRLKSIIAKTGKISSESLRELQKAPVNWIYQGDCSDSIVVDTNWMIEHVDGDDQELSRNAKKVKSILEEEFGDRWTDGSLLYLFPE